MIIMLRGYLGRVGVLGEKRCGLMSLINNRLGFLITIGVTCHINFQFLGAGVGGGGAVGNEKMLTYDKLTGQNLRPK